MQLQRHGRTRLHDQALHLEAIAVVDAVVAAPRAEHFAVQRRLVAALRLELGHQCLDVLHAVARRHQHGILGLDDDVILEAHGTDQAAGRMQVAAARILDQHVARSRHFPGRRAGVRPAGPTRNPRRSSRRRAARPPPSPSFPSRHSRWSRWGRRRTPPPARRVKSRSRVAAAMASSQADSIAGAWRFSSARYTRARNMNMPLFQ